MEEEVECVPVPLVEFEDRREPGRRGIPVDVERDGVGIPVLRPNGRKDDGAGGLSAPWRREVIVGESSVSSSSFDRRGVDSLIMTHGLSLLSGSRSSCRTGFALLIPGLRIRGTRVWIFIWRFFTRALISLAIWTPFEREVLVLDAVESFDVMLLERTGATARELEVAAAVVRRAVGGVGSREGEIVPVEAARGRPDADFCKCEVNPACASNADCPDAAEVAEVAEVAEATDGARSGSNSNSAPVGGNVIVRSVVRRSFGGAALTSNSESSSGSGGERSTAGICGSVLSISTESRRFLSSDSRRASWSFNTDTSVLISRSSSRRR